MSQLDIFTLEREEVGKTVDFKWLDPKELSAHPRNPRRGVPAKLDAYIRSMEEEGYRPDKPMLVRPIETGYQIIGGHSRQQAAIAAGLDSVLCCIEAMDDDEAILRMASDNLNDPFPWYSNALYVVENSSKNSKKGLSRTALVKAATGKEDNAASIEGNRLSTAGEVIQLLEQSFINERLLNELLDPETVRLLHLAAIHKAPQLDWPWLVTELLANDWSVKETEAAAKAIASIGAIPEYFHEWLKPDKWKKEAIKDNAIAKDVSRFVKTAEDCLSDLEESATVWQFNEDGEPYREVVSPRKMFLEQLPKAGHPSDKRIAAVAAQVHAWLDEADREYKSWQARQASDDEAKRQNAEKGRQRLEFIRLYTPTGHNLDIRELELVQ